MMYAYIPNAVIGLDSIPRIAANALWHYLLPIMQSASITMANRHIHSYGSEYTYSGISHPALPIPDELQEILDHVNLYAPTDKPFNQILINYYPPNCVVGIGKHKDNEPELGYDPVVVSISLGDTCDFLLHGDTDHKVSLKHGDVLLMGKGTQLHYSHSIPKSRFPNGRISLTFRHIH